jgi:flagellar basal body rod protein FlgC
MYDIGAPATEMDLLTSAADGMSAQRRMLDIAARNVAAAQASTPDHPYARLVASIEPRADVASGDSFEPGDSSDDDTAADGAPQTPATSVSVHSEPGSGDSLTEMIAVLDAQRAYEQHASVFDIAKRLAERTIDIGRG